MYGLSAIRPGRRKLEVQQIGPSVSIPILFSALATAGKLLKEKYNKVTHLARLTRYT